MAKKQMGVSEKEGEVFCCNLFQFSVFSLPLLDLKVAHELWRSYLLSSFPFKEEETHCITCGT